MPSGCFFCASLIFSGTCAQVFQLQFFCLSLYTTILRINVLYIPMDIKDKCSMFCVDPRKFIIPILFLEGYSVSRPVFLSKFPFQKSASRSLLQEVSGPYFECRTLLQQHLHVQEILRAITNSQKDITSVFHSS